VGSQFDLDQRAGSDKEPSVMPTIEIEKEQLLDALLQLSRPELEEFVRELFSRKIREEVPCLPEKEAELLMAINQGLPDNVQKRLNKLIKKRQSYTITEDELQELIQLTDQAELFNVERMKHLIELSHIRNVPLDDLIRQLGLKPVLHD
jgi:hypothetical protein